MDVYKISEKLAVFKDLKKSLKKNDYKDSTKVNECELDGLCNVVNCIRKTPNLVMTKKIRLL